MNIDRRTVLLAGSALALGGIQSVKMALAQDKPELVLGASLPLSGFFGSTSGAVNIGIADTAHIKL